MNTAVISKDGVYRYSLTRQVVEKPSFGGTHNRVLFVMLNPSTADASVDDPTIRRCMDFTRREGYSVMEVVNLFAYRATDPKKLLAVPLGMAQGPDNIKHISRAAKRASVIIMAYGANRAAEMAAVSGIVDRVLSVFYKGYPNGRQLYCLGTTKSGYPKHPLYLKKTQPLVRFKQ